VASGASIRPISLQALASKDCQELSLIDNLDTVIVLKVEQVSVGGDDKVSLGHQGCLKDSIVGRIAYSLEYEAWLYAVGDSTNFVEKSFRFSRLPPISTLQPSTVQDPLEFIEEAGRGNKLKFAPSRSRKQRIRVQISAKSCAN